MTVRTSTAPDRWSVLTTRGLRAARPASNLLAANGHFRSLARFALREDGKIHARAEIPPVEERSSLTDLARSEMTRPGRPDTAASPAGVSELCPELTEVALAAARDCGWPPRIHPGGEPVVETADGTIHFGRVGSTCAVHSAALPQLPGDPACCEAVIFYLLSVSKELRLVRPLLSASGALLWQVPLPDDFNPPLLAHALSALAVTRRETSAALDHLAASPSLASAWMQEQHQT